MEPILKRLEKLWDKWDIPTCILISLFLQCFLVLFASYRRSSKNSFLQFLIWSAYLSADWIAALTVGMITKFLTDPHYQPHLNHHLYAFWASFLLLHLGGPDTITSYALEDNELWLRHLLQLIFQVASAAYCIFLTLSNKHNMWVPTILILVVGSVKYAERTLALYLASMGNLEVTIGDFEDPNADPETAETEGTKFDPFNLPLNPDHIDLLVVSYSLFKCFKEIVFEYSLNSKMVKASIELFDQRIKNPELCMKVIEYELSFMYEVLHTKAAALRSTIGLVFRFSSFCFIVGAFILFHFAVNKDEFGGLETSLTYSLLIGAIGVDATSGIQLMFCDWILVSNDKLIKWWRKYVPKCVLKRRRWCESVPQYNMIDYCLHERWLWKLNLPDWARTIVDNIKMMVFSSSEENSIEDLKNFIFEISHMCIDSHQYLYNEDELIWKEQMLQLHLKTEIGYHQTHNESRNYSEEGRKNRERCRVISDYMFYLRIKKPEFLRMTTMGIHWKKQFDTTFEEAKKYMMEHSIVDHIHACNVFDGYSAKEKDSNQMTLLSIACSEAQKLKHENAWKVQSVRWVEALCYVAISNRPMLHTEQVNEGGELLTLIWLLLYHLGASESGKDAHENNEKDIKRLIIDGSQSSLNDWKDN